MEKNGTGNYQKNTDGVILILNMEQDYMKSEESTVVVCENGVPNPIEIMQILSQFEDGSFCHVCKGRLNGEKYEIEEYLSTFGGLQSNGVLR